MTAREKNGCFFSAFCFFRSFAEALSRARQRLLPFRPDIGYPVCGAILQTKSSLTYFFFFLTGQLNAIMGVVQAIVRLDDGRLAAESDYRKGGRPAGF